LGRLEIRIAIAIIISMRDFSSVKLICVILAGFLSACTKYTNWDFQRQIFVPYCKIDCTSPTNESIELYVWGEDEHGELICQAQPNGFQGNRGKAACKKTYVGHCENSLQRIAAEKPDYTCSLNDSFSQCLLVNEKEYEQRDFGMPRARADTFPECDSIINNE
jgi:hypothetical protein